jgi:hypothetical protein
LTFSQTKSYPLKVHPDGTYAELTIPEGTLPAMKGKEILYICLKAGKTSPFLHQGTSKSLQVNLRLGKVKSGKVRLG